MRYLEEGLFSFSREGASCIASRASQKTDLFFQALRPSLFRSFTNTRLPRRAFPARHDAHRKWSAYRGRRPHAFHRRRRLWFLLRGLGDF